MFHNDTKGIVTKVIDLKCNLRNSNCVKKTSIASFKFGGIFSDFELAWLYCDSILKIINVSDGLILSSWDFSTVTNDNKTEIKSVIEYPVCDNTRIPTKENQICIIVSYISKRDSNKCSYISFCHPRTSRILHTITTKEKITCLSLIATRKDHSSPVGGLVKLMSGALALGTKNGNLLILDIKDMFSCVRRNSYDSVQTRFSEMLVYDFKKYSENEIKDKICKLDDDGYHIAISLSEKKDSRDHDQEICALSYISQGTTLAVGLKNGTFQLWDISSLKKLYKSSSLSVPTAVVRFGFQEPCNDPQNFCYLWVLHESQNKDQSCLPFAVMYGVLYKRVSNVPCYGRHYKNFVHCKKRFDLDVDLERCVNGRCISSSVVSNTPSNMLRHVSVNEEDLSKINLFVMAFETWERDSDINSCISLVVFDMNQWYKAQMPHQCYLGYSVPFINFMLLERVSERKATVLDMRIKKDTIQQFLTFNLSEEYSYPSSLSFDTLFLSDSKIVHVRVPGAQRSVLEKIVTDGPSGLINPSKYFTECKEAGLRPCFSDSYKNVIVPSQVQQRNYVLTILLENKMSSFLVQCVREWADGSRGMSECTLPSLIRWAWECIFRIKQSTDVICIPLFDYSGDDLDRENYQKLKHCCQLIQIIRDLFIYIQKNYKRYLMDDKKLKQQIDTLQLVTKYFTVIIWCLDCGLLPEKVSNSTDKCIPTYMINIMQCAEQRREELKTIAKNDKYFLIENSVLYTVDSVLENEPKGKTLQMQWERESGGMSNGQYPPVTLQSLLRMFLLPDLPLDVKHFIIIYFLLDVCDYHRDEDVKEQLFSFSVVFSIDISYFSLVQACWLLDHEKFEDAADILLMDTVITQLQNKKHLYKTILQACVCQRQFALALKFERLIKLSSCVFTDERFYITLLLQNGLAMEAYTTLKKNCFGQKALLQHFFEVCDDLGLLKEIFKFPITPAEEEEFMLYLDKSKNKDAGDIKVMYLLSRGRYIEAVDVNHNLGTVIPKFGITDHGSVKQSLNKGRTTTRDQLVKAFSKTLPSVTNKLINFCREEKDKIYRFKEVTKPTPLSVVVNKDSIQQIPIYKSSFEVMLQAAISKTAETWTKFPKITDKINRTDSIVKDTPFLRSDIMTPRKDRVSFLFDRERTNFERKKLDPGEPPKKRLKYEITDTTFGNYDEMNNSESLLSPCVEVKNILRTPHVQKRLNKLLQNTPESSPLTSILKSSEISRFKQPQKVGFSVPEVNKKSRKSIEVQTDVVPQKSDKIIEDTDVSKSLLANFEKSPKSTVGVLIMNAGSTKNKTGLTFANDLLNDSVSADSYYSLESDNESVAGIADFDVIKTRSPITHRIVESMSEEENIEDPKRIVMEVMSEEEIVKEKQDFAAGDICVSPTVIVENVLRQETPIIIAQEKESTAQHQSVIFQECPISEEPNVLLQKYDIISVEQPPVDFPYRTTDDEIVLSAGVEDVTSSFSNKNSLEICDQLKPDENLTFAPLHPVTAPAVETKDELPSNVQPSWQNVYEQYNEQRILCSDAQNEENDQNVSTDEGTQSAVEEQFSSEPQTNSSLTVNEIRDTSSEEDSDIEIVEDNITVPVAREMFDELNDVTTEENDDMSEKTYESDYSYSHESVEADSFVEEASSIGDDENMEEVEEEYEDDLEESVETEEIVEDLRKSESEESDDNYEKNPQINYDELRKIVSTVAAAEAKANEVEQEEMKSENESQMPVITSSFSYNENDNSVCEIYDVTTSVIEETVNMDYSDSTKVEVFSMNEMSVSEVPNVQQNEVVYNLESDDDIQGDKNVPKNDDQQANTSVEVLSLSSAEVNKSAEDPPMIFYFGENSVTSIVEELLIDEPHELDNSKGVRDDTKSAVTDYCTATSKKCDSVNEDQESYRENDGSSSSGNVASEKQEGFEEEAGCLTATQPECNIHYIEKIDIEDNQQYKNFETKSYCDVEEVSQKYNIGPVRSKKRILENEFETVDRVKEYTAVRSTEQPEDLSHYDVVARERTYDEAKEASRLDICNRDDNVHISAEDCYKVDSINKTDILPESVFVSAPDTCPLDLVVPGNTTTKVEPVCCDSLVEPVVQSEICNSPVRTSPSIEMAKERVSSTVIDTTGVIELPRTVIDTTYTLNLHPPVNDITYTIESRPDIKSTTYTVASSEVFSATINRIDEDKASQMTTGDRPMYSEKNENPDIPSCAVASAGKHLPVILESASNPQFVTESSGSPVLKSSPSTVSDDVADVGCAYLSPMKLTCSPMKDISLSLNQTTPTNICSPHRKQSSVEKNSECSSDSVASNVTLIKDSEKLRNIEKPDDVHVEPESVTPVDRTNLAEINTEILVPSDSVIPDTAFSTPRRSLRIACRQSVDSIPDAVDDDFPVKSARSIYRRSIDTALKTQDDKYTDDNVSVKSGSSVAESASSRVSVGSTQSSRQTRSFSRLELRKSSAKRQFKSLEVILSDEEQISPAKSDIVPSLVTTKTRRRYAASEPGDYISSSRPSKKLKQESEPSDDEKLSIISDVEETKQVRRCSSRKKSELQVLNDAMLETPSPVKNRRGKKPVSSTPRALTRASIKKRQFKPLVVIPSDEESSSFQTPQNLSSRLNTDEESVLSSTESKQSKMRRVSKSKKNLNDFSDLESSISDVSNISSARMTRRMRRSLGETFAETTTEKKHPPDSPSSSHMEQYTSNRRLTRNQKIMMEKKSLNETTKNKKENK